MAEPLIKLDNVWKTYQLGEVKLNVLKNVSLEINPGSFVTIMGPSGSGSFSENEIAEIRGQKIGFVFQQFNLLPNLSALENVSLPMVFQGVSPEQRVKRAEKLLNDVNLGHRISHKPSELSGGEQQRVALARSLANDPDIIVADEPTGNLDSSTGKMIMEILTDFHKKEGKTIIVVTHDSNIAEYSKEIINIQDGQVIHNHVRSEEILWKK